MIAEAEANKRFCNKILQACRYTLLVTGDNENLQVSEPKCSLDRWILSRLALMIQISNDAFENREFARAVRAIREFFYYEFCDFYLVSRIKISSIMIGVSTLTLKCYF